MLRLKDLPPAEMDEVVRVASELYQRDQREQDDARERQHVVDAAVEVGLPAEYLELAAAEIHQRKVAETISRRRRKRGLFVAVGLALGLGTAVSFGVFNSPQAKPASVWAPQVLESFSTNSAQRWELNHNSRTQASVRFTNEGRRPGVAVIQVDRFVRGGDGRFFANLDMVPRSVVLTGSQNVKFEVKGSGLPYVRLYLENGPLERWRSPKLPVPSAWETRTVRLDKFEYQTRKSPTEGWRVHPYQAPDEVRRLSFKLGDFVNEVNTRGQVALDDVRTE